MTAKKKPAAAEPEAAPEVADAVEAEAAAPEVEAAEQAAEEAEVEAPADEIDPELVKINSALRPMRAADGSDGSCDLYKADKDGHLMVPASDVPAMLEHGFVLVDEA